MHKHIVPSFLSSSFDECAELFDNHMLKHYPVIKPMELLTNLSIPDVEPPLKLNTHKAAEDNA